MVDGRHGGAHAPGDYGDDFDRFGGYVVGSKDGFLGGELFAETGVEFRGEGFGGAICGRSGAFLGGYVNGLIFFFFFSYLL